MAKMSIGLSKSIFKGRKVGKKILSHFVYACMNLFFKSTKSEFSGQIHSSSFGLQHYDERSRYYQSCYFLRLLSPFKLNI